MKKSKAKKAPRSINAVDIYIGARIRERRLALNLSQAGLGEVLGVSFQQVHKYEGGKNRVSAARLFEICRILNLSLSSMFERNPQA
jgi:transcriptional regulator with XRE-family HTH domain